MPRDTAATTPLGHPLRVPARALGLWVMENSEEIVRARATFDAREH